LWLAETSQQPISQITWLKVIPVVTIVNINHYMFNIRSLAGRTFWLITDGFI
jgi:hypothetical protein